MDEKSNDFIEDKKIKDGLELVFRDILELCGIGKYRIKVKGKYDDGYKDDDKIVFSTSITYPYREIILFIRAAGYKFLENNDKDNLIQYLLHEAFHVWHWRFCWLAEERFTSSRELADEEDNLADKFSIMLFDFISGKNKFVNKDFPLACFDKDKEALNDNLDMRKQRKR